MRVSGDMFFLAMGLYTETSRWIRSTKQAAPNLLVGV
jgi:hypothetical protein